MTLQPVPQSSGIKAPHGRGGDMEYHLILPVALRDASAQRFGTIECGLRVALWFGNRSSQLLHRYNVVPGPLQSIR